MEIIQDAIRIEIRIAELKSGLKSGSQECHQDRNQDRYLVNFTRQPVSAAGISPDSGEPPDARTSPPPDARNHQMLTENTIYKNKKK